ncbi:hypothetical protein GGI25_003015 [Coemansia spiralis]|uniref:BHLH domain-containing protein n=2 Tax=Coemansia TaxID=4863 RepID=A0A9W8KXZ1_9FUNG|nr:hypothetical protein EDC05_002988 [Coemansia umbellata]KAJ2622021.1 hypothetical protein GGI26_003597 [Coemansia sp. RSA 1358]KAJ2677625.1 hypothetical protein GGI25_003015 [Coemansia spiralis]
MTLSNALAKAAQSTIARAGASDSDSSGRKTNSTSSSPLLSQSPPFPLYTQPTTADSPPTSIPSEPQINQNIPVAPMLHLTDIGSLGLTEHTGRNIQYADPMSRGWIHSLISQLTGTTSQDMDKQNTTTELQGPNSNADIPRSLSFPMAQHLSHTTQSAKDNAGLSTSDYRSLTDMLEIGYDSGGRRVISMPNPLGNLFETPINPVHPQYALVADCRQVQTSAPLTSDIDRLLGLQSQLGISAFASLENSLPSISQSLSQQAVYATPAPETTGEPAKKAKWSKTHSCSADANADAQCSKPVDHLPPLPFTSELPAKPISTQSQQAPQTLAETSSQAIRADTNSPHTHDSNATTPLLSTAPGTPMSALIPHRVDRQLAAAGARPLLFVRPRGKDDQQRRRKRRCVSANETDVPAEENSLQWQRISEQRRRDAMRENFDLLKRMLPQAYMDSDDGRELARPVLLARFLRWVDDTLIEMEGLKAEVTRLKTQVEKPGSTVWPNQVGSYYPCF